MAVEATGCRPRQKNRKVSSWGRSTPTQRFARCRANGRGLSAPRCESRSVRLLKARVSLEQNQADIGPWKINHANCFNAGNHLLLKAFALSSRLEYSSRRFFQTGGQFHGPRPIKLTEFRGWRTSYCARAGSLKLGARPATLPGQTDAGMISSGSSSCMLGEKGPGAGADTPPPGRRQAPQWPGLALSLIRVICPFVKPPPPPEWGAGHQSPLAPGRPKF